jgi:hypothetical protein
MMLNKNIILNKKNIGKLTSIPASTKACLA